MSSTRGRMLWYDISYDPLSVRIRKAVDFHRATTARIAQAHGRFALVTGILFLLTGDPEPEVIRVRVPAQDVSRFFPAGTELRVMTPAEFDAKVAAAFQGPSFKQVDRSPRLIRARHHAYVSSGSFDWTKRADHRAVPRRSWGVRPGALDPAIVPTSLTANVVGARFDGKPTLWIDQGSNQTIHLEWELQARTYSRGRGFVLRLPGGETSVLSTRDPRGLGAGEPSGDTARTAGCAGFGSESLGDRR